MRAKEFITEQKLDGMHDALDIVSKSLPHTFVIPELKNQDFYELYRFGVALAAARGEQNSQDAVNKFKPDFRAESSWGEHQVVSSFDPNIGKLIDTALSKVNKHGKKAVSTPNSDELDDTITTSPIKPFKGYKK